MLLIPPRGHRNGKHPWCNACIPGIHSCDLKLLELPPFQPPPPPKKRRPPLAGYTTYRVYTDKPMHSSTAVRYCPGLYSVRIQHWLTSPCRIWYKLHCIYLSKGSRPPISLTRTRTQQYARSEYYTQLAKMNFDDHFDLRAEEWYWFLYYVYPRYIICYNPFFTHT